MKLVPLRELLLALLLTPALSAQFYGLSSATDGSAVYFATTLRLRNTSEPRNSKIFVATQSSVSLFRARETATAPPGPCIVGGFADYAGAETSSAGTVALTYLAQAYSGCSFPPYRYVTQIVTPSGDTDISGITRISASGRFALTYLAATARPSSGFALTIVDLQTGVKSPVPPPITLQFGESVYGSSGRVIANDGTAILGITDVFRNYRGYLLKPGGAQGVAPQPFPDSAGMPLIIDAAASKVICRTQSSLYILDLRTSQSTLLGPAEQFATNLRASDDVRRLLYILNGQAHVLDTVTLADRPLLTDPEKISEAAISGDGKFVHAVTDGGRLLKINVDDASQTELIGRTPYLSSVAISAIPGFTTTLNGVALSDTTIQGTLPLTPWLGNVTMWIGERKVPVTRLTPTSVSIIVPWDIQPAEDGTIRIQAEVPADRTPFYFPEVITTLFEYGSVGSGAIARQDWTQTYVGPINTGEIIHVYAIGLGPVSPDVPEGTAAPATEPFARLAQPLTCPNAEVLYAGLSPGTVERVYQVDIRIGPTPGYQKFNCTQPGRDTSL